MTACAVPAQGAAADEPKVPKYIFCLLVMVWAIPSFQAASDYLGAIADSDAMDYDMDRADGEWALSDYVQKGIEVLDNDTGFFMMCEGGRLTGHVMQMMPAQRIKQRIFIKW